MILQVVTKRGLAPFLYKEHKLTYLDIQGQKIDKKTGAVAFAHCALVG